MQCYGIQLKEQVQFCFRLQVEFVASVVARLRACVVVSGRESIWLVGFSIASPHPRRFDINSSKG